MSGVRNLRAMFEQKGETSPPDRGRSPGIPLSTTTSNEAPRPLSKVRTNFIAVEKDGRMGLRRDPSTESSHSIALSQRRLSVNTEGEVPVLQDKPAMPSEEVSSKSFKTNVATETIPESPRQTTTKSAVVNGKSSDKLGALSDHPSTNPDKHVDVETPTPEMLPGDPRELGKTPLAKASAGATNGAGKVGAPKTAPAAKEWPKPVSKAPAKLGPISTKATTKAPAKSPTVLKTPTSPAKAVEKLATRTPDKSSAVKASSSTPKQTARPASSIASGKKPAPVQISPVGGTGFVKPKPKSPTRPVRLPASLTAGTASSASKAKDAPRESLSRASGNIPVLHPTGRSPSRASVSTVGTTTNGKNLKRQSSTINRPRPSIGPPPKKTAQDHPVTKKERQVDEGFLARMMRPTQASNSKLAEKAPVTPPRKTAVRKETSAKKSDGPKKSLVKPAATATATSSADPHPSSDSVTTELVPETAKVETAEEAIEIANEAGGLAHPVPEEEKVHKQPASATDEAAHQPGPHTETIQEPIQTTHTVEDPVTETAVVEPESNSAVEKVDLTVESAPEQSTTKENSTETPAPEEVVAAGAAESGNEDEKKNIETMEEKQELAAEIGDSPDAKAADK